MEKPPHCSRCYQSRLHCQHTPSRRGRKTQSSLLLNAGFSRPTADVDASGLVATFLPENLHHQQHAQDAGFDSSATPGIQGTSWSSDLEVDLCSHRPGRPQPYIPEAERAREEFHTARKAVPETRLSSLPSRNVDVLLVAAKMIDGELEYRKGNYDQAFTFLREATKLEDNLPYTDPPT